MTVKKGEDGNPFSYTLEIEMAKQKMFTNVNVCIVCIQFGLPTVIYVVSATQPYYINNYVLRQQNNIETDNINFRYLHNTFVNLANFNSCYCRYTFQTLLSMAMKRFNNQT